MSTLLLLLPPQTFHKNIDSAKLGGFD